MKLYDLGEDEKLQIIARKDQAFIQYETRVLFCKQNVIFIEPIHYEDKIVNFNVPGITISIVYVQNGEKPITWEGCAIRSLTYDKKRYQVIYSDKDGTRVNRREAYRQYIGEHATLRIDRTHVSKSVIVKDISVTGVSFVSDSAMTSDDIGRFHLEYQDRECKLSVSLSGTIIRDVTVDPERKVFGGVIQKSNLDLNSYIVVKQKNAIAKRHRA